MAMRLRERPQSLDAQLGYAADREGRGVVYARLARGNTGERLLRVPFRTQRFAGLDAREVGYAALTAIATLLHERGIANAAFHVSDDQLVRDVNEHREVPLALVLPYVHLGCALNRLASYTLDSTQSADDLVQRARAEVALLQAA